MCKRGDVDGCICLTPGTLHRRAVHFTINQLNIDEKSTFNTTEAAKEEELVTYAVRAKGSRCRASPMLRPEDRMLLCESTLMGCSADCQNLVSKECQAAGQSIRVTTLRGKSFT